MPLPPNQPSSGLAQELCPYGSETCRVRAAKWRPSLCSNHHILFDAYHFFMRYVPEKFIFINYSQRREDAILHGKSHQIGHRSPIFTLPLNHEWRVRGHNPFVADSLDIWLRTKIGLAMNSVTRTTDGPPAGMLPPALNADVVQKSFSLHESRHHGKPVRKKVQAGMVRLTRTLPSISVNCN
ncbi:hypothetical protein AX14_012557 [Amanita brunnescens Koide BX004]|nr:hypothetical protein AX14_012557 [Amanita brunnescens Koide BX004]